MKIIIRNIVFIILFLFLARAQNSLNSDKTDLMNDQEKLAYYSELVKENYISNPLLALNYFDEVELIDQSKDYSNLMWNINRYAANAYLNIGNNEKAFEIFEQLLYSRHYEYNPANKLNLLNDLAEAYKKTGNSKLVIRNYKLALEIVEKNKDYRIIAEQLKRLGTYYFEIDSLSRARRLLTNALNLYIELDDQSMVARSKIFISKVKIKESDFDMGYSFAEEARNYYNSKNETGNESEAVHLMGVCKCRSGKFGLAKKLLDEAINLALKQKSSVGLKEIYFAKLELLIARGERDSSKVYLDKIIAHTDSVSLEKRNSQLSMFRIRLDSEKDEARKRSEELAKQKNISLFLSIVSLLALIILTIIFMSFLNRRKAQVLIKKQNQELKSTNKKFTAFIDQTDEAICLINSDGQIILWNNFFEILSGINKSEAENTFYKKILHQLVNDNEGDFSFIYNVIDENFFAGESEINEFDISIKNRNGEIKYLVMSSFPIYTEKETFVGIICNDDTLQKKYEMELIRTKNLANSSEIMKTQFLTQMSHEIRSPINTILSFTSLLETELSEKIDEDLGSSFISISNAGNRIIRTIDLLLNMSEVQSGVYDFRSEKIDLVEQIINPLFDEYSKKAEAKDLVLSVENNLLNQDVSADLYSTKQIIANLLDNSVKYTIEGNIDILLTEEDSKICVSVIDTGIGIGEEYLNHLFEPFSQEEQGYTRSFEGNGLGLALVKNYCDLNNITILVSSRKRLGSTFKLIFN